MFERKNESRVAGTLTLGAARDKLIANGYDPVSLLAPEASLPPYMQSEHPVAIKTLGRNFTAALILTPPEDTALDQRIRTILERRGLTRGPCRLGSDQRELWPLQCQADVLEASTLEGAVELVGVRSLGMGQGQSGRLIPLDGVWSRGTLLDVPFAKLPALSSQEAAALFEELNQLKQREAYVPPPPPPRRGPTAWDLQLAEMRRNPEALRQRLHELTGNPAMQEALLLEVRRVPAGG